MNSGAKIATSTLIRAFFGLLATLAIFIFSFFPLYVERWYSVGIYPGIGVALRLLTRWAPLSLGDLLYACVIVWLIVKLVKWGRGLWNHAYPRQAFARLGLKLFNYLLGVYILFKLLWGLNYDRLGIAYQLQLSKDAYTKEEVSTLTNQLIDRLNECRRQLKDTLLPTPALDTIYRHAFRSYGRLADNYAFLNYSSRSVKASLFSPIADYVGFTGYYNPFTGEAQLRTDMPRILVPYVTCHEMAHQLGYASESEANFVGYLAAAASDDVYFRYSVYLELFSYAQGEEIALYVKTKDFKGFESIVKNNRNRLDTLVKKDRRDIRGFFDQRKNRIAPAMTGLYDQYLKLNKQLEGMNSYNEVVGWLIAYQKKYGKL